jgi:hypothetical protein
MKISVAEQATGIVDFVRSHQSEVTDYQHWSRHEKPPTGVGLISIFGADAPWYGDSIRYRSLDTLKKQFLLRVADKNAKVASYKANLPGLPIYLLMYSFADFNREFPTFADMDKLQVPFDFDRVFFFSALNQEVIDITIRWVAN